MRDWPHGTDNPRPEEDLNVQGEAAFDAWLRANHARETEIWLRIYKKDSDKATVTLAEALNVVLCWGWIDGIRKAWDRESFLQRYSPRRARSIWSQINREHVGRLTAAGRMKAPGQRQIDAAKADGRCVRADPRCLAGVGSRGSSRRNRACLSHEQHEDARRPGQEDRVVAMLARGETIVPERGHRETR